MSRFEKFQNIQIRDKDNNPINGQISVNDCIINFANGYINNWYNETEKELYPAIDCIDGHIEYWENGKLNRDNAPAVISAGNNKIQCWSNGKKTGKDVNYYQYTEEENKKNKEIGIIAEKDFSKYLNKNEIPFIHLDQPGNSFCSIFFMKQINGSTNALKLKRPDYIISINNKPLFVDVKATSTYTLDKKELEELNRLKDKFSIDIIFAFTKKDLIVKNIDKIEFKCFSFLSLDNMNEFVKVILDNKQNYGSDIFNLSKSLLNENITLNKIEKSELQKINKEINLKNNNEYFYYSDRLKEYLNNNNYKIIG